MNNLELLELRHDTLTNLFEDINFFDHTLEGVFYLKGGTLHKYDTTLNISEELCPQIFTNAISIKVLQIEQKVCIVTIQSLYIVDINGIHEVQNVNFESKINAIEWNPLEEVVAVVFENGNIEVFSVDYENGELFSQGHSTLGTKVPDTVYVGWGSKDTQFRGSEGKLKNKTSETPGKKIKSNCIFFYLKWRYFILRAQKYSQCKFIQIKGRYYVFLNVLRFLPLINVTT